MDPDLEVLRATVDELKTQVAALNAIQCLCHTLEFMHYFGVKGQNPPIRKGKLAFEFGELLRKLLVLGQIAIDPSKVKAKLVQFALQFGGNDQHDSQELLVVLMDGLHQDLNCVKHKPYIEFEDANGRPDEVVADNFHVRWKCTSVAYTVTVPKQGHCSDLIQLLAVACSLKHNEKLLLAEIRRHKVKQYLEDLLMDLASIKDDGHFAACKIPKLTKSTKFLQLIHLRKKRKNGGAQGSKSWKCFGTPLVSPSSILSEVEIKSGDTQEIVHTLLSPMLRAENVGHPIVTSTCTSVAASDLSRAAGLIEECTETNFAGIHGNGGSLRTRNLQNFHW